MKCSEFQEWLDQGCPVSSPRRRRAYAEHRDHCPACARKQVLDQAWQEALRDDAPPLDDGQAFARAVLDRAASLAGNRQTSASPAAFDFRRHGLPLGLAALLAISLLSGLWWRLGTRSALPDHAVVPPARLAVSPLPGEVIGQLVRQVQQQWMVQPLAWLDGMPRVNLPPDWPERLMEIPVMPSEPAPWMTPETQHDTSKSL